MAEKKTKEAVREYGAMLCPCCMESILNPHEFIIGINGNLVEQDGVLRQSGKMECPFCEIGFGYEIEIVSVVYTTAEINPKRKAA